jgi:hypothetical protein
MRTLLPALPVLFVLSTFATVAWFSPRRCHDCGFAGHEPGTPDCPREMS